MKKFLWTLVLCLSLQVSADPPTLYHHHADGSVYPLTLVQVISTAQPTSRHYACKIKPAFLEAGHIDSRVMAQSQGDTHNQKISLSQSTIEPISHNSEDLWIVVALDLLIGAIFCTVFKLVSHCVSLTQVKRTRQNWKLKQHFKESRQEDSVFSYDK